MILLYEPFTEVGFSVRDGTSETEWIEPDSSQTTRGLSVVVSDNKVSRPDDPSAMLEGKSTDATNSPEEDDREVTCKV
jgi:hypothetical protein